MAFATPHKFAISNFDVNKAKELQVDTCENRFEYYAESRTKELLNSLIDYLTHPSTVDETFYIHKFDFYFTDKSSIFDYIKTVMKEKGFTVEIYQDTVVPIVNPLTVIPQTNKVKISGW